MYSACITSSTTSTAQEDNLCQIVWFHITSFQAVDVGDDVMLAQCVYSGGAANFTMLQSLSMSTQSIRPYALCRLPCAYVTLHITILRVHHISFHVLCPKGWCRIKPISHCPLGRGCGDDVMLAQCVHSGGAANFTMLCSHSPSAIYKSLLSAIMKKLNSGLIDV